MARRNHARLRAIGVSAVVALALLLAGRQLAVTGWYSASPMYRAQVDALLAGRLALSEAPEALFHDLAWTSDGVQQVWGLGVPAWQTPFELAGRVIGVTPFPNRVPLLAWLTLMVYVLVRALWPREPSEPWWLGAGAILITALLPAFVTLIRGRVGIYEEAAIYAYAAAMILLGSVLRLAAAPTRWRFFVLLACAGLAGFVRPPAWSYGFATAIVASALWLRHRGRRGLVEVAIGGALFAAGGAAIYATNAARFGSGTEFGHRLNLQSLPGNLYATRFSYPMASASLPEAALELAASLFDRPELRARGGFFQKNLHHGVSQKPRWREYYFTTYAWGYVPLLVAGLVLGGLAWRRRDGPSVANDPMSRWLFAWALLALVPLLAFYLRAPFVSSRYQLDLAPAFAALLVVAWRGGARWLAPRRHGAWVACGVLVAAWIYSVVTARTATPRSADPIDREAAVRATALISDAVKSPRELPAAYDLADPWLPVHTDLLQAFERCTGDRCLRGERAADSEQWVVTETVAGGVVATHRPPPTIYLNLYRWNLETGQMPPATYAFVENPRFIELEVSTTDGATADWARDVRARVGLVPLTLVSTKPSSRGTTLRFEAPNLPRGLVAAFFAFGPDDELHKPMSRIAVHAIRWR
jgi:hypothetical protein